MTDSHIRIDGGGDIIANICSYKISGTVLSMAWDESNAVPMAHFFTVPCAVSVKKMSSIGDAMYFYPS